MQDLKERNGKWNAVYSEARSGVDSLWSVGERWPMARFLCSLSYWWFLQIKKKSKKHPCGSACYWSGIAAAVVQVETVAWVWSLAQELPYAVGVDKNVFFFLKNQKKNNSTMTFKNYINVISVYVIKF